LIFTEGPSEQNTSETLSWLNVVFAHRDQGCRPHTFNFWSFAEMNGFMFSSPNPIQPFYFKIRNPNLV